MNNKRNILLAVTVLLWASLACQSLSPSDPDSIPPETAATEENSPLSPSDSSATEEAPAQSGGAFDGIWNGTNSDDSEIVFEVTENQISSVTINYQADVSGCTFSGAVSMGIDPSPISGESFSATFTAANDYTFTFAGSFTSETEASGTILVESPSTGMCGEFEKDLTWSAGKGSDSEADAGDTEDSSGTSDVDETAVVTQFFDAVNAGDLDSALDMVDENVMFSFGANGTQFGRDNLKGFLSSSGLTYQISETESFGGGMAQFTATASDGTTYSFCTALFQDGKIVSLTLQP